MWLENLNAIKKASGKTLKQISSDSGVPLGTLNKLFAGQTKDPKLDTVCAVVHALGYTLNDIDPGAKESPSTDETAPEAPLRSTLLHNFDQLNQEGQERLVETSDDMVSSGKYIKSDPAKLGKTKGA